MCIRDRLKPKCLHGGLLRGGYCTSVGRHRWATPPSRTYPAIAMSVVAATASAGQRGACRSWAAQRGQRRETRPDPDQLSVPMISADDLPVGDRVGDASVSYTHLR